MDALIPDHRRRLLDAMATTVASKGYAALTIADLAGEARVSKRSFYEQFRDKADCFIALYELASRQSLIPVQNVLADHRPWPVQVEHVMAAYLGGLARQPALLSTLFIDIMALGDQGLFARRRATEQLASLIVQATEQALDQRQAVALVAGVHEWVLQAAEAHQADQLPLLAAEGARLVCAVADTRQVA